MSVPWGDVVAGLVGAGGLALAFIANRTARKANELAKGSNESAARAVRVAEESNRIAEHANELSEHANQVVTTQAAQQVEKWLVQWRPEWDGNLGVLTLVNDGRDAARCPFVVIKGDDIDELREGYEDVPRHGALVITFPEFPEDRLRENARFVDDYERALAMGIIGSLQVHEVEVVVTVHWQTGLGQPREQVLNLTLQ
jgi:hypothetical protein